jgi:hypothetical protein
VTRLPPIRDWRLTATVQLALLIGCGLGMLLIFATALVRFPLLQTYDIQILTLDQQVLASPSLAPAMVVGIVLLCALYVGGYVALSGLARSATSHWRAAIVVVVAVGLAALLLLLFAHPTTSLDLYDYLYRGQIAARYGANNFVQSPEDFRTVDRLYWYTAWRRATTAYGPLWELLSIAVARLSGPGLLSLLIGFKLLSALGWLLCAVAIWLSSSHEQRPLAVYLWLWNPLVLWELLGAGHNDGWMLLFGVLALWALPRSPTLALLLLTAGALIKYPLGLLAPVLLAAALAERPSWWARGALLLRVVLLCGSLVLIAYAPWWVGPATLQQLHDRTDLFTNSPLALLRALWQPDHGGPQLNARLALLGQLLLVLGVLAAGLRAWFRPRQRVAVSAALLLWFSVAASPWVQPWYLIWPIALLALQPRQVRPRITLAAFALSGLLLYPAYSALRPLLGWPGDDVRWQLLVLVLLYLPPLLILVTRRLRPGWARGTAAFAVHAQERA